MGATSLALSRELVIDERGLIQTLRDCVVQGLLVSRTGYVATTDFEPELTPEQRAFFDAAVAIDPSAPNVPTSRKLLLAAIPGSPIVGLSRAFDTLVAQGTLCVASDDVYRDGQIGAIRADLNAFFAANERLTVAQFRDLLGTSRRYAVPLLEWFDACGITVREGDDRVAPNCVP